MAYKGFSNTTEASKAGKKSSRKGVLNEKTRIFKALTPEEWDLAGEKVKRNIFDFLDSEDENTRKWATEKFAPYFKARKTELSGDQGNPVQFKIIVEKFI